jgi:hypothetical protein
MASIASGRSGIKMKPWATPFRANPIRTITILSGRPSHYEGPWRIVEPASIRKDIKINNLLGILPEKMFTAKQLMV